MSDLAVSQTDSRTPSPPRYRVKGKLAIALALMVDEGKRIDIAAQEAGLTTRTVRDAFMKPHVIDYVRKRRVMLRESINAKNDFRLAEIRDAANNTPAVNAIAMLERMNDVAGSHQAGGVSNSPGVTIVINSGQSDERQPVKTTIDLTANPPDPDDRP